MKRALRRKSSCETTKINKYSWCQMHDYEVKTYPTHDRLASCGRPMPTERGASVGVADALLPLTIADSTNQRVGVAGAVRSALAHDRVLARVWDGHKESDRIARPRTGPQRKHAGSKPSVIVPTARREKCF